MKKPDQPQDPNLSFFVDLVKATTDADGWAVFDWIPQWNERSITIWPRTDEYVRQRGNYDPKTGDGTLTMKLDALVPIRGRVTLPDGSPAEGIQVMAAGKGHQVDGFNSGAETDADGRYEIKAAPDMVYLVVVKDDRWAGHPHGSGTPRPQRCVHHNDLHPCAPARSVWRAEPSGCP